MGVGGVGKSTLVVAALQDVDLLRRFPGGVAWAGHHGAIYRANLGLGLATVKAARLASLDKSVAADEFVLAQQSRKDAVLQRSEERGLHAHEEQHGEQPINITELKRGNTGAHDHDLSELDPPDHAGFLVFVRELPCGRREDKERKNENTGRQGHQNR